MAVLPLPGGAVEQNGPAGVDRRADLAQELAGDHQASEATLDIGLVERFVGDPLIDDLLLEGR